VSDGRVQTSGVEGTDAVPARPPDHFSLKKILAAVALEAGDSIHERLCPVTEPFHLIEELLRPRFE